MIHALDLRRYVIEPVLTHLGPALHSESAICLLLGTAAVESGLGERLRQVGAGPAVGIYQMERGTYGWLLTMIRDHWPELHAKALNFALPVGIPDDFLELAGNLYWATAVARLNYWRIEEALPAADDVMGLAHYWKHHWNSDAGAGTVARFRKEYDRVILQWV